MAGKSGKRASRGERARRAQRAFGTTRREQPMTRGDARRVINLMDELKHVLEETIAPGPDLEPVDAAGAALIARSQAALAAGEEELLPGEMVDRLHSGESRVRVWREHRGLSQAALAKAARVPQANLSLIENGARTGSVATLQRIAHALGLTLDDVAPLPEE